MNEFTAAELSSVHDVKVMLCYLLEKLKFPVTESQLDDIVLDSEVINYFLYTEAVDSLLKNGSVSKVIRDGETYIQLEEKGRLGADYFNEYIPHYFRKYLLKSALYYFAKLRRESETDIEILPTDNGCEVNCTVKDTGFDLMRISLYAPDENQANLIREKIMLDPAGFYSRVIGYALENKEEPIKVDAD